MPIVFKGAALAHTHYADSWRRPRYDSDVLITSGSRERVFSILEAQRYTRRTFVSGELVMYQMPFERIDHLGIEHALDIHWRVANPQVVADVLTHDALLRDSVIVTVQGYPLRVPSPVHSLLLACVHRVAHHANSERPIWIHDIHLLATRFESDDWLKFVDLATRRSVRAVCAEGLRLARDGFQTPVPADVLTALTTAGEEPSAVFLRKGLRPVDRLTADLRALGPRAAARLMREHLFPPAAYMRAAYGVRNRALLPAYYLVRAVGGVSKWFRAA